MTEPRIIFFGSKDSKFSDELFISLADTRCRIVAAVHSAEGRLVSTSGKEAAKGYSDMAESLGIPCFQPDSPNTPEFVELLRAIPCEAFILGGYALRLKDELLALPKMGIAINFHASLLPEYRGKHPVFWAIRHGEKKSGITAHHLSPKIDEGNIAYQEPVDIECTDSVADVYAKVIEKSHAVMHDLINAISRGDVPAFPQKGEGCYYSSITEEDYILDFTKGVNRNLWAVQATPGKCYVETPHGRIFAFEARASALSVENDIDNGTILDLNDDTATVSSDGAAICFRKLSMGREPVSAGALLMSLGYMISDKL